MTARFTTINNPWSIGFDDILRQLEEVNTAMAGDNYPPHNIVRIDDDNYIVELAVAGFADEELDVSVKDGLLVITGAKDDTRTYAYKGISTRKFVRSFKLNEHVNVKNAELGNGILSIELERVVPEADRPRKIKIGGKSTPKTILNE